ncbi:ABC transporter ATP-binding protein [Pyrococcus furiosus DSM 3638]|uniref:ABC transporter ATP-binding protein n=3 Tax=Pyrococcus furiosus TaxID=2261 RepID=A0A5C0XLN9_PYRFU|nr:MULTISPECIES: ABC transporter ATP-binding protein [Pyrococcus]AAL80240.1 putative multiple sugar transport protein [Pyrococcus furiosus DSM 3638]AFN04461.1 multiple sugar transport protein [Pyrococcus furiosus COM1]MDK2870400.1 inositol-phosphate transport system ATP-binding protein [Pyrococcus sp.]QEK77846.1 ABC transporter ATP-binding protein [Pyrococcus furiosus DSM 3638]
MVSIKLEGIVKKFGNFTALDNINLTIKDKEFMALLGPSGSGKSTLLYTIAGIYKPTAGRIYFDDRDVTELPPKDRNVGLVFQNWALYPHMTVYKNIAFPLELRKLPKEEIDKKVREVAKILHIENLLERYPWQLSGGQQQRVAIARALVKEPDVLLLDEPLSNLDALLRLEVRAELKRLQKDLDITAVYVTHDQAEALAMADRIAVIKEGKILQVGDPDEVYHKPKYKFVGGFLGNPPMNFIEAKIEDGKLVISSENILDIPPQYREIIKKLDVKEVYIGFRPHDVEIVREGKEGLVGEIYSFEPLGREQILTIFVNGNVVKVFAPEEEHFRFGEKVNIKIKSESIVLFDKKTEKALEFLVNEP